MQCLRISLEVHRFSRLRRRIRLPTRTLFARLCPSVPCTLVCFRNASRTNRTSQFHSRSIRCLISMERPLLHTTFVSRCQHRPLTHSIVPSAIPTTKTGAVAHVSTRAPSSQTRICQTTLISGRLTPPTRRMARYASNGHATAYLTPSIARRCSRRVTTLPWSMLNRRRVVRGTWSRP